MKVVILLDERERVGEVYVFPDAEDNFEVLWPVEADRLKILQEYFGNGVRLSSLDTEDAGALPFYDRFPFMSPPQDGWVRIGTDESLAECYENGYLMMDYNPNVAFNAGKFRFVRSDFGETSLDETMTKDDVWRMYLEAECDRAVSEPKDVHELLHVADIVDGLVGLGGIR